VTDIGVSLREITWDSLDDVLALRVKPEQKRFVATNAKSLAQAHFQPERAWFRAIHAGDWPVGFIMTYEDNEKPEFFLWRLMVAGEHQGKGYGRRALELLVVRLRAIPQARELVTCHVPGESGPGGFYKKVGFRYTGEKMDDELLMKLELRTPGC
jgi:diamine N-acetyltransferase